MTLKDEVSVELPLSKQGDNRFKVFVFDVSGRAIPFPESAITITRTAAVVDAIPASHTVGLEVLTSIGGPPTLEPMVRAGDDLPAKGQVTVRAGTTLKAGESGALNFKIWEGEIEEPIEHNRMVGTMKDHRHGL